MFPSDIDRVEYSLHLATAELFNVRALIDKPEDVDVILKEISFLEEKIAMRQIATGEKND